MAQAMTLYESVPCAVAAASGQYGSVWL